MSRGSTPPFSSATNRNIFCKISRQCLSRYFTKYRPHRAADARPRSRKAVRASPALALSVRHDGETDANRKRFDGRDDRAHGCSPRRVHASSNDVIPSAIHISAAEELKNHLIPALEKLHGALEAKAKEFWHVIKIGRTHLMDATPVRLGQEFSGYAQQVAYAKARAEKAIDALREVALGGTAVGTGLNRHIDFPKKVLHHIKQRTGIAFYEAKNHFEAQGGKDAVVEVSGHSKTIAVTLFKIANDIRWLSSGPRCGIGEIQLPATQPGSSIMPGKVNPVMAESLMMVCAQVIGNDVTITWAGANGNFELNVIMPVMAHDT